MYTYLTHHRIKYYQLEPTINDITFQYNLSRIHIHIDISTFGNVHVYTHMHTKLNTKTKQLIRRL